MTTYISEATQAKYLNILKCVNSIKKMYEAVRMKDYVMGGINENSHGMRISIKDRKSVV